jgi:dihydropteroate synthase
VQSIAIDPGLGFGKTVQENLALVAGTAAFVATGHPVLVGASRKSFIGAIIRTSFSQDVVRIDRAKTGPHIFTRTE